MSIGVAHKALGKNSQALWRRLSVCWPVVCLAFAAAFSQPSLAVEKPEQVQLALRLVIASKQPLPTGDVLGLYAVEVLACPVKQSDNSFDRALLSWLDSMVGMVISSAWANHRDHFDRPGARIVPTRVPLDRSASYPLGSVVIPSGFYCQVRLTLTRLPKTDQPKALPALDNSIRLTRPGSLPPIAVSYVLPLELPFSKPWHAGQGKAELTMTLDPSAAKSVLADASLSEGALLRLIAARWVATSNLSVTTSR